MVQLRCSLALPGSFFRGVLLFAVTLSAQDVCVRGAAAARERDLPSAERLLRQCTASPAASAESFLLLGSVYQAMDRSADVYRTVVQGAAKFPDEKRFVLTGASIAGRRREFDQALALLRPALERWPEDEKIRRLAGSAWYGRGTALLDAGDNRGAAESLKEAVRLAPEDAEASMNLGRALHNLHRYDEALRAFDAVQKIDPSFPLLHFHRGTTAYATGDLDSAAGELTQAIVADPDYPPAYLLRGLVLLGKGDAAAALPDLATASSRLPDNADAQFAHGRALMQEGQFAEAEPKLRRTMEIDPADPAPVSALATALIRLDRRAEAQVLARSAAELARRRRTAGPGEVRYKAAPR